MSRAKRPKLTNIIRENKRIAIGENSRKDLHERSHHNKLDNRKLRESVLNKLWDSLPPETQNLPHSNDEDSDSTQSGLDEGEFEGEESDELVSIIASSKDIRISGELISEQLQNTAGVDIISNNRNVQSESCRVSTEPEDSVISWETNLDFIQSIIWLKSATARLQRVSADEFLEVFKNQWELSPKIRETKNVAESQGPSSSSTKTKTKQLEKLELIKKRLTAAIDNNLKRNKPDIVIPESDDSGNPSLQSSQYAPDRDTANIRLSDSTGFSTVDSGFGSDKPEFPEATNSSQCPMEIADESRETENSDSINAEMARKKLQTLNLVPGTEDRVKLIGARGRGFVSGEGHSRGVNLIGENHRAQTGRGILKRKHDAVFGAVSKKISKRPSLSISSATLNYVLRSSECNKVLLTSVQRILEVLENAGNGYYLVQKEAIDAVVNIVDLLDKEKGPNSCRNEVVAMIKRVLETMLNSGDVDKLLLWEHHRLVILELCNSSSVCRDIVNYLISELKELISVATQTTEENMRASLVVMDKSFILFHSLKVALKKYRSFAPTRVTNEDENASQKIPEVTDLWKRHWKPVDKEPDIFVTGLETLEIPHYPEELWTTVLEELVVVSTTIWPLVKILAWQCLAVLKSPASSAARDG